MLQPRVVGLATLVLALSFGKRVHAQVINDLGLDRVAAERVRKLRAEFAQAMQTEFEGGTTSLRSGRVQMLDGRA